jgi:glycosyltransferase involved in cell wall biosynthesis
MAVAPILLPSDAPTAGSGLGRIAGDLARRIAENMQDTFRVATFGYGGVVSRHLPYHQYIMEGSQDFVCPTLPEVWDDWAGDEKGVCLTINDLSRLGWLLRPEKQCENPILREFLLKKPFKVWTYLPTDAGGPNDKLTFPLQQILKGSDRILAYGKWGAEIVDRTMGLPDGTTQFLPHGIDTEVFYERDRAWSRKTFVSYTKACTLMGNLADRVKSDEVLISIVATNQARKDFALGIETVALLSKTHNVRLWVKTDVAERHWSIPALLLDFGVADRAMITIGDLTDDELARAYSASDLVLGIAPEGFGYVHVESLSCGTPCIVGSYGGGAELVPSEMRVNPVAFRYESIWSCKRPVYNPLDWTIKANEWIGRRATMDSRYDWKVNWIGWDKWLREGVA